MGTWAEGPFDNDTALDELGDLARSAGSTWDDVSGRFTAPTDPSVVDETLAAWLARVVGGTDEQAATRAYAALGLMAMALAEPGQLRLTVTGDDTPLRYGSSFRALLDGPRAEALLPRAAAALQAVFDPAGDWRNTWPDTDGIDAWATALAGLLRLEPVSGPVEREDPPEADPFARSAPPAVAPAVTGRVGQDGRLCEQYQQVVAALSPLFAAGPLRADDDLRVLQVAGDRLLDMSIGSGAEPDLALAVSQVAVTLGEVARVLERDGTVSPTWSRRSLRLAHRAVVDRCPGPT